MTMRSDKAAAAALALVTMLAGCAHDGMRGDTSAAVLRATLAAQVANPAAARNPNPASGLDGQSARAAVERYEHAQGTRGETATASQGMLK